MSERKGIGEGIGEGKSTDKAVRNVVDVHPVVEELLAERSITAELVLVIQIESPRSYACSLQ